MSFLFYTINTKLKEQIFKIYSFSQNHLILFINLPIGGISQTTSSPYFSHFPGLYPMPTPDGVPVAMISPASKVIPCDNSDYYFWYIILKIILYLNFGEVPHLHCILYPPLQEMAKLIYAK